MMKINGLELDENYPERRRPHKSRNLIIRFLDAMCSRINGERYFTVWTLYLAVSLPASLLLYGMLIIYDIDISWYFWMAIFIFLPIDDIYRHYRHKYIKRHNLPGPYGWGTLDEHERWTYVAEFN